MLRNILLRQSRRLTAQTPLPSPLFRSSSHFPPIRILPSLHTATAPRLYSTTAETSNSSPSSEPPPSSSTSQASNEAQATDPAKSELEAKNKEIIDLKDKYLRSVAEFRNLQDRTQREIKSARQFAITGFARDLIESVDNLDRALSTVDPASLPDAQLSEGEGNKELNNLYQGLKMTDSILMQTLKKHGLERFDPMGEKFDPNLHDATFMTKVEGKDDGSVFEVIQKGFTLNGRVVRAAKVGVVKNN